MASLDFVTLICSVFLWISWLVAMAGAAAAQADGVSGTSTLAWTWWVVWFTFFLLIFICFSACVVNPNLNRLRTYLLLMATVMWMLVANEANLASKSGYLAPRAAILADVTGANNDLETDAKVVLAGAILMSIFNFILIGYWGLTEHAVNGITLSKSTEPAPAEPTKQVDVPAVTADPIVATV